MTHERNVLRRVKSKTQCEGAAATRGPGVDAPWVGAPAETIARRLEAVKIPPQYPEATLCLNPASRVQGYGRDRKGRLQILYHPQAVEERQARKVAEVLRLCEHRARVLARIRADALAGRPLGLVAWVLLETAARPGHERYRSDNGTFGASNLRCGHVHATDVQVRIAFPAKHGKPFVATLQDPEVTAALLRRRQRRSTCPTAESPFWGEEVDADALNAYLEEVLPGLRAKSIRTWRANLHFLAAWARLAAEEPDTDRCAVRAVRAVAAHLQNTPAVAQKQYLLDPVVHMAREWPAELRRLTADMAPSDALHEVLRLRLDPRAQTKKPLT